MMMAKKQFRLEPRNLALAADLEFEGAWRVEYFDIDGACYITIFTGQAPELRARDYYDAIERGVIGTRIADAQVGSSGGATRLAPPGERQARGTAHRRALKKAGRSSARQKRA
jgi:hypothetical protein